MRTKRRRRRSKRRSRGRRWMEKGDRLVSSLSWMTPMRYSTPCIMVIPRKRSTASAQFRSFACVGSSTYTVVHCPYPWIAILLTSPAAKTPKKFLCRWPRHWRLHVFKSAACWLERHHTIIWFYCSTLSPSLLSDSVLITSETQFKVTSLFVSDLDRTTS